MRPPILKAGARLKTTSGEEVLIIKRIGYGGQGEVYEGKFRGEYVAVKIFFEGAATSEQLAQIKVNIDRGPPSNCFVWPCAEVAGRTKPVGCVMPLVDLKRYTSLKDRMQGKVKQLTFYALVTACIELVHAMHALHAKHGSCFVDLNADNLFVDSATGAAKIIDTDNCAPQNKVSKLWFTPPFAAPEILLGTELPSDKTDLYSLTKIIFMLLTGGDPFDGKNFQKVEILDLETYREHYAKNPVFVFDPKDSSNRPDESNQSAMIGIWNSLPAWFQDLFIHSFTVGNHHPEERIREVQWIEHLIRLRDLIGTCTKCSSQVFHDDGQKTTCWSCKKVVNPRRILDLKRSKLVLNVGTRLFPHHIDQMGRNDVSKQLGKVIRHPNDRGVIGLRNDSERSWKVVTYDGSERTIEVGSVAPVARGNRICFGKLEGQVI